MDNGRACIQVKELVRTFDHVRDVGFILAGWLGEGTRMVKEYPFADINAVVGFPKALTRIGIVTAFRFVAGRSGFNDLFLKLFQEFSTAFFGWWTGSLIVMERELLGRS